MNLYGSLLGSTAVRRLQESADAAVLEVGTDKLTRGQLAKVECYNFLAARLLSHSLKELKVANLRYVYDKLPPAALALPHLGVVSLAVLGAAFEAKGIGDLESYVKKHLTNGSGIRTFDTIKRHEQAEVAQERKQLKKRKAQRRDQAHAMRVERFEKAVTV